VRQFPATLLALCLTISNIGADQGADLRKVVEAGNEAWIKAGRDLKNEPLEAYFAGTALADLAQILASMREDGAYMDLELVKVVYRTVMVDQGGKTGSVAVSEYWRVTYRRIDTHKCEVILKPRERRQTYRLQTTPGGWRIFKVEEEPNLPKIETQECPS
jgi:hypothetical protein